MTPLQRLFKDQLDPVKDAIDNLTVLILQHRDNCTPEFLQAWHEEHESTGVYQDFDFLARAGANLREDFNYHALRLELGNIQLRIENMTRDFTEKFIGPEDEPKSLQAVGQDIIAEYAERETVEGFSPDNFDRTWLELADELKTDPYTFFAFTPIHLYFSTISNKKLAKILQMKRKEIKAIRKSIGLLITNPVYSVRQADIEFANMFSIKNGIDAGFSESNDRLVLFINNRILDSGSVMVTPYDLYMNYLADGEEFQDLIYARKYQIK